MVLTVWMRNGEYELVVAPEEYPGMKYRGRYAYEHHVVWWTNTGAVPQKGFVIHHMDENKRNNIFSNLELKTVSDHTSDHNLERASYVDLVCICGKGYRLLASMAEWRKKASRSGMVYCSSRCPEFRLAQARQLANWRNGKNSHSPVAQ